MSGGHAWGRLFCPHSAREGCIASVWSTPRNAENHARQISGEWTSAITRQPRQGTPDKATDMDRKTDCMTEHDFFLVLTEGIELIQEVEDALFEAGCDDATLSMSGGRCVLTFTRVAPTLQEAVLSAIRDVRRARIGADVLRVAECSLVTAAEIGRRIRRSRQLVHQYISKERGPGGFPAPVCHITDTVPLWYWCEVAYWLRQNDMVSAGVLLEAQSITLINSILEMQYLKKLNPSMAADLLRSIASDPDAMPA